MGANFSKYDVPLQPLSAPFAVTDQRFCFPTVTTLLMRERGFSKDWTIKDVNTGIPYFVLQARLFSLKGKDQLCDIYNVPVANCKKDGLLSRNQTVYAGADSQLPKASVVCRGFKGKKFECTVALTSGQQALVVMKGSSHYDCTMWIGQPKQGGTPVARAVSEVSLFSRTQYTLVITPGFDAALAVLLLNIYEEATKPQGGNNA